MGHCPRAGHLGRGAAQRALARVQAQPQRSNRASARKAAPRRGSILDAFEPLLKELLAKYPNLTVEPRLARTAGRARLSGPVYDCAATPPALAAARLRRDARKAALRPARGWKPQMDFGVYDIDFHAREGRRRVYLFSYLLGYSRRQYLRFVESMDLPTTRASTLHAFQLSGRCRPDLPVRQLQGRGLAP